MSKAILRNSDGNPYLYLETVSGSSAFGTNASGANDIINLVVSGAALNVDPTSGTPSISVQTTNPGNISFQPIGTGESNFVTGDVNIEAGNLDLVNTTTGGAQGVINYGGNRFVHNYGTNNTFVGQNAGNLTNTNIGARNIAVGTNALTSIGTAGPVSNNNIAIGHNALTALQGQQGNNIAIGESALASNTQDYSNIAIGTGALQTLNGTANAISNVAIGIDAGQNLLNGHANTLIGQSAGVAYTTSETNNIMIANVGTIGESNVTRIGTNTVQNKCFIAGINGTSVTAAGSVVVSSTGQLGSSSAMPTTWNDVTGISASMAINNGYVADNAGLVTLTLPAVATFGSRLEIVGKGSGGWLIAQNAGQTIHFESLSTTVGVGGSLASTVRYDCVELICVTANTDFVVKSSIGNITVV